MLTKKTPETIKATITIKSLGEDTTIMVTYFNRTPEETDAFVKNEESLKIPESAENNANHAVANINAGLGLFFIKSFDDGTEEAYPVTRDGLVQLELDRPNYVMALVNSYHRARAAAVEKN